MGERSPEEQELRERLEMRERYKKALLDESVSNLLNEAPITRAHSVSSIHELEEVAFAVGRAAYALHVPEKNLSMPAEIAGRMDSMGIMRRLARKANIHLRRIQLEQDWYRKDNGIMLGYYTRPGSEKKELAAILPVLPGQYRLVVQDEPQGILLTDEVAKSIHPMAFSCYAGLPLKRLSPLDVVRFLIRQCWEKDGRVIVAASFLAGLASIVTPIITETVFQDIIPILDRMALATVTQVSIVAAFTTMLVSIVRSLTVLRITTQTDMALEAALIGRLFRMPSRVLRRFPVGDMAKRVRGIQSIKQVLSNQLIATLFNVIFSFWSLFLMCYYSLRLTFVAMIIWSVYTMCMAIIYRNLIPLESRKAEAAVRQSGIVQQIFAGLSKFRLQGAEAQAYFLWSKAFGEEWKWNLKRRWQENYGQILMDIQPLLASLLLYYFVAAEMRDALHMGQNPYQAVIGYAQFMAFQSAFSGFNSTLNKLFPIVPQLFSIKPQIKNLQPILEELPEISEDKADAGVLTGDVDVSHLTFAYEEHGPNVLKDVSFHIHAGDNIAIVGRSGCGKSTLVRLLLGFEQPKSGAVYYDGQDLSELDLTSVRSQMGVVMQNGQLMTGDIFTNIVGTMSLSMDDAWDAAEAAGIAEDIRNMPMGMHTILSEGSGNISGGQRQRILIARALAAKPAILIFDEATSALDNRTQAIVTETLQKMQVTRIIIAHRLSTIRDCNRILVIDKGQIAEDGTFDELVARDGLFAELVKRQMA